MRYSHVVAFALVIPMLSGCATYRYGDRTFHDRNEAEAAAKADRDTLRTGFKPRNTPLAKLGRVVIPSKTLVIDRRTKEGASAEARDYVATVLYNDYRNTAETIRQRNVFERLDIEDSTDGEHITPKAGEAVIYLYIPDNKTAGWYYISKTTKRTPLHFDQGNPDKLGRFKYFIDSVEALAAGEQN